ncbi:hypothetical protein MYCTH_2314688 [Thermothelomyces thermophilus ATCC 42464]|uniref:Uncharacterized protein n=1 Tax=Thermothelomyces thermophilus (strain ATCC 42464 / BCRC 31852 / DSM 1799) TaxID=573729 RepID=G2Q9U1_THET4|nr:uncharacterized protein MYCTH_2314688 [Thermothelomyces thermophilus ATCC 42464]AEO56550.1 hypothetical protein MYCTH_2314688 [Thermothelomyces thermophilus ATCC 42464]
MHDNRTHPLLQQVPLTVSPFVKLPTATTLPYRYKPMPSTLPPSVTGIPPTTTTTDDSSNGSGNNPDGAHPSSSSAGAAPPKPRYVVSPSGHAAHPDEILESCRALLAHVTQMCAKAEQDLAALDERIRARDLAEKRRVAPGWLDSEARLLEPEKKAPVSTNTTTSSSSSVAGAAGSAVGGQGSEATGGGKAPGEMLLQQPVKGFAGEYGSGGGNGVGNGGEQESAGPCEMAVPDEGEQLDRAFGTLKLRGS